MSHPLYIGYSESYHIVMKKITVAAVVLIAAVAGYVAYKNSAAPAPEPPAEREEVSGLIRSAYSESGKNFIDIDMVEMNPDWEPGVMTGDAFTNESAEIRTIELAPDAKCIVGSPPEESIPFSTFREYFAASNESYEKYNPWDIVIESGAVTEIVEHFIP